MRIATATAAEQTYGLGTLGLGTLGTLGKPEGRGACCGAAASGGAAGFGPVTDDGTAWRAP